MSDLFEHLAAVDDSHVIAHRVASAVAFKRVKDRFGAFLANATNDLPARLALIEDHISETVAEVVAEHGGDAQKIEAAIRHSFMPGGMPGAGMPGGGSAGGGMAPSIPGAPGAGMAQGQQTCPQCGGAMVNGQCATCRGGAPQGGAYGGAAGAPAGQYGLTHSIPQQPSTGPVQASHEAKGGFCDDCRKWKSGPNAGCTCGSDSTEDSSAEETPEESPFHEAAGPLSIDTPPIMHAEPLPDEPGKEGVTDIDGELANAPSAVGAGATARAAASTGWNRGAPLPDPYEPDVVHDFGNGYGIVRLNSPEDYRWEGEAMSHDLGGDGYSGPDTYPGVHSLRGPGGPGAPGAGIPFAKPHATFDDSMAVGTGNSEIDPEHQAMIDEWRQMQQRQGSARTAEALKTEASAVGGKRNSFKEAEALKTVDLPTGGDSALGGPSPKIDKGKSGDNFGWSLDPIDTQMTGSPNPSIDQDPTDRADYNKKDFLDQTNAVTKSETLPTNKGDAGFDTERNIPLQKTKTFPKGDQQNPVTRATQGSVDPHKNPIREIVDQYSGFLMPNQVESALTDWDVA